ncbi:MAG: chemotaxis protein CheA [Campylobacterota bacterium]|nr:chemotaxis protein CheA [Campylobacterota bacterium]
MNPILEQFLAEARENLLYLDKNLESLEDGDKDTVNALFRAAHTLKGSSGLAGFDAVKESTHIAEDLLDAYRNDKIEYSTALLEALYDMFDEVTELVDATEESGEISTIDEDRIDEFKKLREEILQVKEEVVEGIETELTIEDSEIPPFGSFFKNDFSSIDFSAVALEPEPITKQFFDEMNYYIVDLDLGTDTLMIGNDPFYAMFLLENENIISLFTQVNSSCEEIIKEPLDWGTRIVAIVYSNQELLEDAFYNFLDEVTIYPLTLKSLLNSDLEPQTNDSIIDFIEDLKNISSTKSFESLQSSLDAVSNIVNPKSLQGFIFDRLNYIISNSTIDDDTKSAMLDYIFSFINLDIDDECDEDTTSEELENLTEEVTENIIETVELSDIEKSVLADIIDQQQDILKNVDNENVVLQVKETLKTVQINLNQDFGVENCESKECLQEIIEKIINLFDIKIEPEVQKIEESIKDESPKEDITTSTVEDSSKQEKKPEPIKQKQPKKEESKAKASKQMAKTVKIELSDIDAMMDTVGEMLVIKNSLPYIADALTVDNVESSKRDLQARYDEINRVTTALQEKVMEMRLLSLSFIFDRYPKLVRDISKSLGKKIEYSEKGGDTKLDKTIIEKLADPLIHIIRNSLDHGIETPEERVENGKSKEGHITISANSVGDKVYVTIEDDGRGIDVDKVVQRSLEKKMVNPDELDTMSHEEKLLLVFHPGVSTMEKISELSGRGVGMDVVRQSIDDVGGKISLQSEVGVGTKLTLELPMSVALTNVFHVKLGDSNYALAMDTISETVQVAANEVEYINKQPMLKLRGSLIPLVFNYNLLSKDIQEQESFSLLIIEADGSKFGFIVNEFVNQLDIIQKPLSTNFKNHPFISGTSLLGNGEVLFVINPIKLINIKEKK